MAVTINDVAKKAGVSVTTVSRVLNGGKYVSENIKKDVENAIKELGYTPNLIARSLVKRRTNLLGVIVPDNVSSFFSTILNSIQQTAYKKGYNILVGNIFKDIDNEMRYLRIFKEMRVDGIIIMHETINDDIVNMLDKIDIPIVFTSVEPSGGKFISIIIDDYKASYEATEYLIKLGHKKIAFIGGDMNDFTSGNCRYNGYKKALNDYGIDYFEDYVKVGDYGIQSGYSCAAELLKLSVPPTAIFAVSDDMAVGALNYATDNGYRVPEDLSIIGFDGGNLTEIIRPRLTSMQQPIEEMGRLSVDTALKLINEEKNNINKIVMNHRLVERESCMCIK